MLRVHMLIFVIQKKISYVAHKSSTGTINNLLLAGTT